MPLPGGPSEKAGATYERRWTVFVLLDLLAGRAESLRIEVPGAEGVGSEFCVVRDGVREWHQVKRQRSRGPWSIAALGREGPLGAWWPRLLAGDVCVFVSTTPAPDLVDLVERAAHAASYDEFDSDFLSSARARQAFDRVCSLWSSSQSEAFAALRRIAVRPIGEVELVAWTNERLATLVDGTPETACAVLASLAADSCHVELSSTSVWDALARAGLRPVRGRRADPSWLSRSWRGLAANCAARELDRFLNAGPEHALELAIDRRLRHGPYDVTNLSRLDVAEGAPPRFIIEGEGGSGKSYALALLARRLGVDAEGRIPVLVSASDVSRHLAGPTGEALSAAAARAAVGRIRDASFEAAGADAAVLTGWLAGEIARGGALLLIDGLDAVELMFGRRGATDMGAALEDLLRTSSTAVIATSRPGVAEVRGLAGATLEPLDDFEARHFLWKVARVNDFDVDEDAVIAEAKSVWLPRRTHAESLDPLQLALAVRSRIAAEGLPSETLVLGPRVDDRRLAPVARWIAYLLSGRSTGGTVRNSNALVTHWASVVLPRLAWHAGGPVSDWRTFEKAAGGWGAAHELLAAGGVVRLNPGGEVEFVHQVFWEVFAAIHVARAPAHWLHDEIGDRFWDPAWAPIIVAAAVLHHDRSQAIRDLLSAHQNHPALLIALEYAIAASTPAIAESDLDIVAARHWWSDLIIREWRGAAEILCRLVSDEHREAASVAEGLAVFGSAHAIAAALTCLAEPLSQGSDTHIAARVGALYWFFEIDDVMRGEAVAAALDAAEQAIVMRLRSRTNTTTSDPWLGLLLLQRREYSGLFDSVVAPILIQMLAENVSGAAEAANVLAIRLATEPPLEGGPTPPPLEDGIAVDVVKQIASAAGLAAESGDPLAPRFYEALARIGGSGDASGAREAALEALLALADQDNRSAVHAGVAYLHATCATGTAQPGDACELARAVSPTATDDDDEYPLDITAPLNRLPARIRTDVTNWLATSFVTDVADPDVIGRFTERRPEDWCVDMTFPDEADRVPEALLAWHVERNGMISSSVSADSCFRTARHCGRQETAEFLISVGLGQLANPDDEGVDEAALRAWIVDVAPLLPYRAVTEVVRGQYLANAQRLIASKSTGASAGTGHHRSVRSCVASAVCSPAGLTP